MHVTIKFIKLMLNPLCSNMCQVFLTSSSKQALLYVNTTNSMVYRPNSENVFSVLTTIYSPFWIRHAAFVYLELLPANTYKHLELGGRSSRVV